MKPAIVAHCHVLGMALALTGNGASAELAPSRGQMLYETHCIACHSTQLHWRDGRRANDWTELKAWVARWQIQLGLGWDERDIADVSHYLKERYYRYPQPSGGEAQTWTVR